MTTYDEIAETKDGRTFATKAKGILAKVRDGQTPLWGVESEEDEEDAPDGERKDRDVQ